MARRYKIIDYDKVLRELERGIRIRKVIRVRKKGGLFWLTKLHSYH